MKIITRQSLANIAAIRWYKQYHVINDEWLTTLTGCSKSIYLDLMRLGDIPEPNKVDKIIGNDAWTKVPKCTECGKCTEKVIQLGEEPNYEYSSTANICEKCLNKAADLMSLKLRCCGICNVELEIFTADLDWCPNCHQVYSGE